MVREKVRFKTTMYNIARLETFEKSGVLVVCKFCGECAIIKEIQTLDTIPTTQTAKAVCRSCGKTWLLPYTYERLPLWLSTAVRNNRLWALNKAHLNWLESFIQTELREDKFGGSSALDSVLPRWMTSAKNRAVVVKALSKLRQRLDGSKEMS